MKGYVEKKGPLFISLIIGTLIFLIYRKIEGNDGFDKVLDNTIIFVSIMIGFVGVLLGVLFGLTQNEIIKRFFKKIEPDQFKHYYQSSVFSGFTVVIVDIVMYLRECLGTVEFIVAAIWSFFVVYAFTTTFRVMYITIYLLFSSKKDENMEPEGIVMDEAERKKLEEKYGR